MKAIVEHGGIISENHKIKLSVDKEIISLTDSQKLALLIFDMYLSAIRKSRDSESLRKNVVRVEFEIQTLQLKNPFYSGFTAEGFGIYNEKTQLRLIFVECETDIEL